MHSLNNIAAYILNKYENQISPMKLQKLLYYVKVWTLVAGEKFINPNEGFYAWKFGPVNPSIYHSYKSYGKNNITEKPTYDKFASSEQKLIDFILDSYSFYSALTLSQTTHSEDPWMESKNTNSKRITNQQILQYYSNESFAKNFPLGSKKIYYPPSTFSHYSFIFDMNLEDNATTPYFNSLEEYLENLNYNYEKAERFLRKSL